jgi:Fe-S cluster assembly protein SufD
MVSNTEIAPFLATFRQQKSATDQPKWLAALREAAMQNFASLGYPTRKQEAWRFTDLRPLIATPVLPAPVNGDGLDASLLAPYRYAAPSHRVVLVNGRFDAAQSWIGVLPKGVWLGSTAEALARRPDLVEAAFEVSDTAGAQPFAALNAAFFVDGYILALEPGAKLELPVEIIHYGNAPAGGSFHLRNAIIAGPGSEATVIETAAGTGTGWTNAVTCMRIAGGAHVRHIKVQTESTEAFHISLTRAALEGGARYESFTLTLGARMSRQDFHVAMTGEGAYTTINGAYLLRGEQEATFAPFVDHQAPGCETSEVLKGVVQDRAHGVFLGKMTVREGADQTNAHQLNRNLLLSPQAWVDTKPELEIFADEVKCSHGATVGDIDETALFYLKARGIDDATARAMLVEAFAADVIETAALGDGLSAHLQKHLQGWLGRTEGAA